MENLKSEGLQGCWGSELVVPGSIYLWRKGILFDPVQGACQLPRMTHSIFLDHDALDLLVAKAAIRFTLWRRLQYQIRFTFV